MSLKSLERKGLQRILHGYDIVKHCSFKNKGEHRNGYVYVYGYAHVYAHVYVIFEKLFIGMKFFNDCIKLAIIKVVEGLCHLKFPSCTKASKNDLVLYE